MHTQVWTQEIHEMDRGSLFFEVTEDGHTLAYSQWWENCGLVGETFECSCGFHSTEHQGNGCWQQGHNEPQHHIEFDAFHAEMVLDALERAKTDDVGYPAQWRGLAMLAVAHIRKQSGSMRLIKQAQRIAQ
jgi:hypothetical protein